MESLLLWILLLVIYCLFTLIIYLIVKLILWIWQRYHLLQTFYRAGIPGPKPNFFMGNLHLLDSQYLFKSLDEWFDRYGDVFGYFRGDRPVLVTRNLDLIHEVFIERFREFPNRLKFMIEMQPFSSSVLALRDHRWRQVRRVITPAFTTTKISSVDANQTISNSLSRLLFILSHPSIDHNDYIEQHIKSYDYDHDGCDRSLKVNVSEMSKRYTLDIICSFAFAIDNEDFYKRNSPLFDMVEEFFATSCDNLLIRLATVIPPMKNLLRFINNHITSGRIIDHLVRFLQGQIIQYNDRNDFNDNYEFKVPRRNLLDFILHQIKLNNLNPNEAIGNLLVILLAGYETTACGISFVLFNLAKHPEIQKRLRAELVEILPSKDFDDNPIECEYMNRIIYESLRLYPPVIDYVIREASDQSSSNEMILNHQALRIPKNVAIQVPVWTIHHDHKIWPDPYRFDPGRLGLPVKNASDKNATDRNNRRTFMAFGIGQRSCIGGSLAMAEIRAIVAHLVLRYQIKMLDNELYEYDQNGLLKVRSFAELIQPCQDIRLKFEELH